MSTKIKFFLGALVVAAFAVTASGAGAQTYTFSGTLKQGSKGVSVWNLQKFLNMCPTTKVAAMGAGSPGMETQTFGPATKAAVIRFQAANGLAADGIFGSMSAAKALSLQASGNACGQVVVTPPTNNGNNGGNNGSVSLSGTDGVLDGFDKISSYNNEEVGEGQNDVKVAGYEAAASNDGDIALKSVKVVFTYTGSGSNRLNRYIDGVKVWQGSTEVGSADAEDFNKDSSGVYSKTITLSNPVIKADKTEKFYISVDAAGTFDSADITGSTNWNIKVDSVRFVDGSGVVTSETSLDDIGTNTNIDFVDFSTASDTKIKFSAATTNPEAGLVVVDDQDTTEDVALLKGKIKVEGDSDVTLNELPITFSAATSNANVIASSLKLTIDGEEYTESVASVSAGNSATITFDNLDLDLNAGDTVDFTVSADINGTDDFTAGATLTASLTSTNRDYADIENEQGDQVTDSDKSGTVVGKAQEFRSNGISVALASNPSSTVATGSSNNDDTATFTIKFKVTAVGDDVYVSSLASSALTYVVDRSGTSTTGGVSAVLVNNTDTDLTSVGNYLINEGDTESFTLTVSVAPGQAGLYRAALTAVKWDTSDDTSPAYTYSSNMDDFKSDYVSLN